MGKIEINVKKFRNRSSLEFLVDTGERSDMYAGKRK